MARALKLPKFLKPTEKTTTSLSALPAVAISTDDPSPLNQSHKSHVLPKVMKGTGKHIKKLFTRSKKNGQSLYLQGNDAFCINTDDNTVSAEMQCDIVANTTQPNNNGETPDNVGVVVEEVPAVLEESNLTTSLSSNVIFEVVNMSPRSSPQLDPWKDSSGKAPAGVTLASSPLDVTYAGQIPTFAPTSKIAIAANTTSHLGESAVSFLDLYESYTRSRASTARSRRSIEDGYTIRADHTRTSSDATTLISTSLRDVLSLQSSAKFQSRLNNAHQLISHVQGLQDRRAIERDQLEAEDRVLGLDNQDEDLSIGKPTSPGDQSRDFKALFLESEKNGEEQVRTYEFLLAKAEQDGKNALEEREDEYQDEVKDLRKAIENATKELKDATKELESAAHKNMVVERRLKKALRERDTIEERTKGLAEKCKTLEEDAALKDEQLSSMSSTLQSHREELKVLSGQYDAARIAASDNARVVEENGPTILQLRQSVHILTAQLAQHQQGPAAAVIDNLRNENGRLLGVITEDHTVLQDAQARICALTEALRQAKRDHDRWFTEFPEHSLSNATKVANHLAYKDKIYEDLEKRFQAYTASNEVEQKNAREYKDEANNYINALKTALEMQNEAVNKAKQDKADYRAGMSSILAATLGAMEQDEFIKGLTFHFDLVQKDNQVLATRVAEMDEGVGNLKREAAEHELEEKRLVKQLEVQQEATSQLEDAKRTAVGEIDALKYTIEVAEEGHMQQVKKYESCFAELKSELKAVGDRFSAVNRESASERIRFELNAKDNLIQAMRDSLDRCNQAYVQACYDRDHYKKASELDASLEYADNCNVSFLQRQLFLSEENYSKMQADLDDVHLRNARDRRLSKEALDEEKTRVQVLEKELHELYRNLQARALQAPADTPADTPPRATSSEPAKEKSAAIEDLAGRLWSCLRGLEMAVGAHGFRVLDHDNEREAIRLACADLLGLEEDGSPRSATSVGDVREGNVGNDVPNGEDSGAHDDMVEEGAADAEAERAADYALAEVLINDACDALGYAPNDPFRAQEIQRSVYGRSGEVEGAEGSEAAEVTPGLDSSTDAVLGQSDEQDGFEVVEVSVGDAGQQVASQSSTDGDSATSTDESEASSGHGDDRTVTQEQYDAAAVTPPQHVPALVESTEDTAGTSPTDEGDPDDSMEMTPGTWARRYAPPFMYGEPVEDDMF